MRFSLAVQNETAHEHDVNFYTVNRKKSINFTSVTFFIVLGPALAFAEQAVGRDVVSSGRVGHAISQTGIAIKNQDMYNGR